MPFDETAEMKLVNLAFHLKILLAEAYNELKLDAAERDRRLEHVAHLEAEALEATR